MKESKRQCDIKRHSGSNSKRNELISVDFPTEHWRILSVSQDLSINSRGCRRNTWGAGTCCNVFTIGPTYAVVVLLRPLLPQKARVFISCPSSNPAHTNISIRSCSGCQWVAFHRMCPKINLLSPQVWLDLQTLLSKAVYSCSNPIIRILHIAMKAKFFPSKPCRATSLLWS